ncbi:hypothetical protein DFH09DRAFT_1148219 [Mycena vulgaris]|nr:hypothetical protein DFH09DRAFT_1148219 [Mycena vulgaris]
MGDSEGIDTLRLSQPVTEQDPERPPHSCLVTPHERGQPYPVLTLPTEITAEIFAHCLPTLPSTPRTDSAPLLLGCICSTWRSIAVATPELWSALKIALSNTPVELIETWLSRAQNWPLSLVVDCFQSDGKFIDVLQRHSHTWHNVELGLPFEQFYLFGPDLHLPMLKRLAIGAMDYWAPVSEPITAFRKAPVMRHLRLLESVLPADIVLPWAQLTSFESDALSSDECLAILKYTPNIAECRVGIYFAALDDLPDVPPRMSLISLCISSHLWEVMDILDHIAAPALQALDLKRIVIAADYYLPPLHRFLSTSGCQLREFAIRIQDTDERLIKGVIELLETQAALEKLELRDASLGVLTAVFRRLSDGSLFLPQVCTLAASIRVPTPQQINHAFPEMLEALMHTLSAPWAAPTAIGSQIRSCTITYSRSFCEDFDNLVAAFRPQLEALEEHGVKIYVGIHS